MSNQQPPTADLEHRSPFRNIDRAECKRMFQIGDRRLLIADPSNKDYSSILTPSLRRGVGQQPATKAHSLRTVGLARSRLPRLQVVLHFESWHSLFVPGRHGLAHQKVIEELFHTNRVVLLVRAPRQTVVLAGVLE